MIGEFFGATHNFEYNIGDKLYEFAIMSYEDFDKLKTIYTQLIELVCTAKESNTMDEKLDCFFKMFQNILLQICIQFQKIFLFLLLLFFQKNHDLMLLYIHKLYYLLF